MNPMLLKSDPVRRWMYVGRTPWLKMPKYARVVVGYRYFLDGAEVDLHGRPELRTIEDRFGPDVLPKAPKVVTGRPLPLRFLGRFLLVASLLLAAIGVLGGLSGCCLSTPGQIKQAGHQLLAQDNAAEQARRADERAGPPVPIYQPPIIEQFGNPDDLTTYGRPGHSGLLQVARCQVDVGQAYPDGGPARAKAVRHCYDLLPPGTRQRLYESDREIIIDDPTPARVDVYIHHRGQP